MQANSLFADDFVKFQKCVALNLFLTQDRMPYGQNIFHPISEKKLYEDIDNHEQSRSLLIK